MPWQSPLYLYLLIISFVVSVTVLGLIWRYRNFVAARPLGYLTAGTGWWTLMYVITLSSTEMSIKISATKLMYLGIAIVPVAWLLFAIEYTGLLRKPNKLELGGLLLIPTATNVLLWTNQYHQLVWSSIEEIKHGSTVLMMSTKGIGFWTSTIYSYALMLIGAGLIVYYQHQSDRLYKRQGMALVTAAILPFAANALYLGGLTSPWDLTNLGFTLSGLILLWAMFRHHLLDVSPGTATIAKSKLFDSMTEAVIVVDNQETIVDLNQTAEELIGLPAGDVIGQSISDAAPEIYESVELQADTETRSELLIRFNGVEKHYDVQQAPIRWGLGTISGQLLTIRDITERKEHETELRQFRRAIQATGHVVYITDKDGTIEYVNPAFESITGYSSDEAIGKNPRILNSGEMPEEYFAELWDTVLAGDVWEEEVINERKDGKLYHAHQTIAPITNSEGSVQAFVAIQADITEQKRLEEELAETKERYQTLFNSIRDAILVVDTDRKIINCNPAFTDLFGYELAEIEGKHTKTVYESEEEYQEMGEAIEGHFDDPSFTHAVSYEKKSGQTFPGETQVSYLKDEDGDIRGFTGAIRDVTERKQRLNQLQKVDRILQHNFSNDMNVIEGYAEIIYEGSDEPTRSQAAKIIEASQNLSGTVQKERAVTDFLSAPSSVTALDVGEQAQSIASEMGEQYPNAEISLTIQGHTTAQAVPEFSLAIKDLLRNAVTHAEMDRPTIRVRVEGDQDGVELSVSDENPQIPEIERAGLLEEAAVDPLYHGSGIGLWLVKLIVSHSGGTLEFAENEPRGNVITIRLPAEQ